MNIIQSFQNILRFQNQDWGTSLSAWPICHGFISSQRSAATPCVQSTLCPCPTVPSSGSIVPLRLLQGDSWSSSREFCQGTPPVYFPFARCRSTPIDWDFPNLGKVFFWGRFSVYWLIIFSKNVFFTLWQQKVPGIAILNNYKFKKL